MEKGMDMENYMNFFQGNVLTIGIDFQNIKDTTKIIKEMEKEKNIIL